VEKFAPKETIYSVKEFSPIQQIKMIRKKKPFAELIPFWRSVQQIISMARINKHHPLRSDGLAFTDENSKTIHSKYFEAKKRAKGYVILFSFQWNSRYNSKEFSLQGILFLSCTRLSLVPIE